MANKIIGRERELEQLSSILNSDKAELVAVYGRRRIGKTFLVKGFFNGNFDYYATGIFEGSQKDELDTPGVQIDMLIARRDKVINLCEMKYASYEYEITPKYNRELRERCSTFRSITKTRYALHNTMITPWGLKQNANISIIDQTIVLDNLFDYKS